MPSSGLSLLGFHVFQKFTFATAVTVQQLLRFQTVFIMLLKFKVELKSLYNIHILGVIVLVFCGNCMRN